MDRVFIVKLESYDGRDTFLHCGNDTQDFLFAVGINNAGEAEILDSGYRSYEEAADAWPHAVARAR